MATQPQHQPATFRAPTLTMSIPTAAHIWLAYLTACEKGNVEVSGVALLDKETNTIHSPAVLLQECSRAETTLDDDALQDWLHDNENLFEDNIPVHWHTHPKKYGTNPSAGDKEQYSAWQSMFDRFLALIISDANIGAYIFTGKQWRTEGEADPPIAPEDSLLAFFPDELWLPAAFGMHYANTATPEAVLDEQNAILRLLKDPPPPPPKTKNNSQPFYPAAKPQTGTQANNIKQAEALRTTPISRMTDEEWEDWNHYMQKYNQW